MNVIFRTDMAGWRDAALAKKELNYYRARNVGGKFDPAIKKEEDIIRSFTNRAA
jgi:hypothetical protein